MTLLPHKINNFYGGGIFVLLLHPYVNIIRYVELKIKVIMTKKILLLCLTALFSTATWAYDKSVEVNGVTFYFNIPLDENDKPTKTFLVTHAGSNDKSYTVNSYSGEITIPSTIDMETWSDTNFTYEAGIYTVVGIDSLAFIGEYAYDFGTGTYGYTSTLTSVTIPSTITTIKGEAFERTAITSITIPSSVTFLGDYVFNDCPYLASVTFESDIQLSCLPKWAFYGCSALTSIDIPSSVTSIGDSAFYGTGLTSITIPDNVTKIADAAFSSCTSLTSATLSNSITSIANQLFYNCTALTTIEIPAGVTTINTSAFEGCSAITAFTVNSSNTAFCADEYGVLFNIDKTTLEMFPEGSSATSYEMPESVTAIAAYAFYHCAQLTSVPIVESVTTIGEYAFNGCTGLTELIIPDKVTSMGIYAFFGCTGLTSLTIGTGLTTIAQYAFRGCTGLTELTIPDNVTTIDANAFLLCSGLKKIVLGSGVATINNYAFSDGNSTTSHSTTLTELYSYHTTIPSMGDYTFRYRDLSLVTLYVPSGCGDLYKGGWTGSKLGSYNSTDFANIVELGNVEVGTIFKYETDDCALWYRTTSETTCEIIMPQDGDTYRFNWDDDIYLTIPEYAEYAGEQFRVTRIDDQAFDAGPTFKSGNQNTHYTDIQGPITIPANIVSIGKSAFANNSDLASDITFADGEEDLVLENTDEDGVEGRIFHESDNGGTVYLGRNIVFSGDPQICSPFYDDASSTSITIGPNVTEIPDYMFCKDNGNVSIKTIDFTKATSLETIGAHSFAIQDQQTQSNGITELTLPASLKSIGDGAFYGTKSLSTVTLQSTDVTVGGPSVFGDGSQKRANAVNLHVPEGSLSDYEDSDWGSVYYVAWADEEEVEVATLNLTATRTSESTTYYTGTYYNSQYEIKISDVNWSANVVDNVEKNGALNNKTVYDNDYLIAGNAVIVECTASNYDADTGIVLTGLRANATPYLSGYDNILYGSDEATTTNVGGETDGYYFYMLSYDKDGENLGFYWGADGGAPFTSAAHKAWLALDSTFASGLSQLSFKKDIDDTTGISSVETDVEGATNGAIYTIQGVRVNDMTQPGIYIQNGKKVLVK